MQTAYRMKTVVGPGNRVEVSAPGLTEGVAVEVLVLLPDPPPAEATEAAPRRRSMWALIRSLPPGPRSAASWEQIEADLRAERDAWDR